MDQTAAASRVQTYEESSAEGWHDLICRIFSQSDFTPPGGEQGFRGQIQLDRIGPGKVSAISASPLVYTREARTIRKDPVDGFMIMAVREGELRFTQNGETGIARAGDLAIYRHGRPFRLEFPSSYRAATVWVPPETMALHCHGRNAAPPAVIRAERPNAVLARATLINLAEMALAEQMGHGGRVLAAVMDLLATALDPLAAEEDRDRRKTLLAEVEAHALRHLDDSDLGPEPLAAAFGVSARTLNRLFATRGQTTMQWIWAERLERARAALEAGRFASVTEAAFAHGFKDSSHFSRAFSSRFGTAPSQVLRGSGR